MRCTGFGRNRVLRDRNLFILLGFEGAKCRICWIFGTSREVETGVGGLFRVGLSGGTFGWDARTTSAGPGCLRGGETGIFGSFSGARKMSARSRCLRSRETRGRHFSVRFLSRGLCQQDHVVFARASLYGHCCAGEVLGNTRTTSGRGRGVCGRGRGAKYGIWEESCTSRLEFVHFAGF